MLQRVGNRVYFYRYQKCGGRSRRVYVASGEQAEEAAARDAASRAEYRALREAARAELASLAEADARLEEFIRLTDTLARTALMAAGFHQHARGAWRRRRMTQPPQPTPDARPAPNPTPGSGEAREALAESVRRAERGDATVLPDLRAALDADPSLWHSYCDVGRLAEAAWLKLASGTNLMLMEAIRRHVQGLKAEVAGADPSPLERLLADRVALCWLQCQECDAACGTLQRATLPEHAALLRRQNSAHRRLLQAIQALARVRRLLRRAPSPVEVATRLGASEPAAARRNSPPSAAAEAARN
jgi:hypothetical protein